MTGSDESFFVALAENYLWLHRKRPDLCFTDVNPDVHTKYCPIMDAEHLGAHLHRNKGKYHKSCRVRYGNTKIKKLKEALSTEPAPKAAKRERHVSAHDNIEAALMNSGIEAVKTLMMEQEKVSPGLYLVSELQQHYNNHIKDKLPEDFTGSSGILSDHVTKFSEKLTDAITGLRRFTVQHKMYACFDDRIIAGLAASLEQEGGYDMMCTKVSDKIRDELFQYSNEFKGHFDASILSNSPSKHLRSLMNNILDGDPDSITKEADMLTDIIQFNCRNMKSRRKVWPDS